MKPKSGIMPLGEPVSPTLRRELDDLWDAIRAIRDSQDADNDQIVYTEKEITFSFSGKPKIGDDSPVYHVRCPTAHIVEARLSLGSRPSSDSASFEIHIKVNGLVRATIDYTYNAEESNHALVDDISVPVSEWDRITVSPASSPTGVSNVTVQLVLYIPDKNG